MGAAHQKVTRVSWAPGHELGPNAVELV
jgi:hypothetical protein